MVTRPAHSVFALVIVVHFFPIYGLGQGRTVRSPQWVRTGPPDGLIETISHGV
jgi:hypothetical protein